MNALGIICTIIVSVLITATYWWATVYLGGLVHPCEHEKFEEKLIVIAKGVLLVFAIALSLINVGFIVSLLV